MRKTLVDNRIYFADFIEGGTYHVYNRTNNKEPLFKDEEDHLSFLSIYNHFLNPLCLTYAYCLIPNHFHFLIQLKSKKELLEYLEQIPQETLAKTERNYIKCQNEDSLHLLFGKTLSRMFGSYTHYYNRTYKRKGNLFNRRVKRRFVFDDDYFKQLLFYINTNSEKHGLTDDYKEYLWSSSYEIKNGNYYLLDRNSIIDKLGRKSQFFKSIDKVKLQKLEERW